MTKRNMGEVLEEMRKKVENQVLISTATTTYKGRIKSVLVDCVEFEDRSKVQTNIIYIPFAAIESFSHIVISE